MAKMTIYVPDGLKARMSKTTRTCISVPMELKDRMEKAGGTNWSAVACRAFERELSRQRSIVHNDDMTSVITLNITGLTPLVVHQFQDQPKI